MPPKLHDVEEGAQEVKVKVPCPYGVEQLTLSNMNSVGGLKQHGYHELHRQMV